MDDFAIIVRTKEEAKRLLAEIREWIDGLGLELNQKTGIFPLRNGIDLLGFHSYLTETGACIQKLRQESVDRIRSRIQYWRDEWFEHATEQGGRPISFVQNFYGLSYPEAVARLLGVGQGAVYAAAKQQEQPKKEFALPPANRDMRRVYAYLLKRLFLDRNIVSAFVHAGLLYESCEKFNGREYHNDIQDGILEPDDPLFQKKCRVLDTRGAMYWVHHLSWWKEELPSEEEYQTAKASLHLISAFIRSFALQIIIQKTLVI